MFAKLFGVIEFRLMNKKIFAFFLLVFTLCVSFADSTPVEKLCNVKIDAIKVVANADSLAFKIELKNFSDKSYALDLSYQIFEMSFAQKLVCENIKAKKIEISANEKKTVEFVASDFKAINQVNYKLNLILTYKPEVFIGFFNNDKIIDEKSATFSLLNTSSKKE